MLSGITIDDSAGDAGNLGHNTDAFDVGDSVGVRIEDANVKNQDDCLAINSGTVGVNFLPFINCIKKVALVDDHADSTVR